MNDFLYSDFRNHYLARTFKKGERHYQLTSQKKEEEIDIGRSKAYSLPALEFLERWVRNRGTWLVLPVIILFSSRRIRSFALPYQE